MTAARKSGKGTGDVGPGRPPKEHQFKPGNPGRPKGSRNKLGEKFLDDLAADWEAHGMTALETTRLKDPAAYVRVVASILPKELLVRKAPEQDLSDEELLDAIDRLKALVGRDGETGPRPTHGGTGAA